MEPQDLPDERTIHRALRLLRCQQRASRRYYESNKEAVKRRSMQYWEQNREAINARRRQRYEAAKPQLVLPPE
jgi:hypothetical protein